MNSQNKCCQQSRSPRFNVPVQGPSRWSLLLDQLLASPRRIHSYRDLGRRMVEDAMRKQDCGDRK